MPSPDPKPLPYPPASEADRQTLTAFARETPLAYGTWREFKRLYKQAEASPLAEPALYGTLAARVDAAPLASSTAALPVELGMDGSTNVTALAVSGRMVYCLLYDYRAGRQTRFAGFDFDPANPLNPALLGSVDVSGAHSLVFCGPFVCVLSSGKDGDSVGVFDPTDLSRPAWRGQIALGGEGKAAASYPYVYAAVRGKKNSGSGLRIVDLTAPDRPQIVGEVEISKASQVAHEGMLAAVTFGEAQFQWGRSAEAGGLALVSVADPRRPRILGTLPLAHPSAVALRGPLALVGVDRDSANGTAGLQIVDVSDPARPRKRGFLATSYYAPQTITLHGDFAYVTLQYGATQVVNLRNPDAPTASSLRTSGYTYITAIAVSGETAYAGTTSDGLELYTTVNPAKPARIGTPPRGATLGYLKRRVRRTLRGLAKTDPDGYVSLAAAVLAAARPGEGAALDTARQWVLADILYGGAGRFRQGRHGRGPLGEAHPERYRLRRREERTPEAWDRHPETVAALLQMPALPWPVHEAMLKIALARQSQTPSFSPESLAGFVLSPSPLLVHFAVRTFAAQMEQGGVLSPRSAATAFVKAGVRRRRTIEAALDKQGRGEDWNRAFAAQTFALAAQSLVGGLLPRRYASACERVARRFPGLLAPAQVRELVLPLLSAGRPGLTALVLALAGTVRADEATEWLDLLQSAPEREREQAVAALADGLRGQAFTLEEARFLVVYSVDELIRANGWKLLAASATDKAVFSALWTALLDSFTETPALRTAMASPAALAGLARAGLSPQTIADRLRDRPFLARLLSPATFAAILPTVPPSVALSLIAAVADNRWADFRPSLRDTLREGRGLAAFWLAVPLALASDVDSRLERRLLGDAEIADTLVFVDNPEVLAIREPAFDAALGRWAMAHGALFSVNSSLLLQAATQTLPAVRAWALNRVGVLGLDLPFALRLLESALPASVEVGGAFFASLPPGAPEERGYALALCDSPLAPVRARGRAFVTARWETLPQEEVLRALFENSHADMQAFVAGLLSQSSVRPAEAARFDGEVLRARHTARRAKEQVKARQSAEPTVDTATLLALARSRTPRDAEWALGQLAKRALAGQKIEGFTVTGTAGG